MGRRKENSQLFVPGIGVLGEALRSDGEERNGLIEGSVKEICEGGISSNLVQVDLRWLPSLLLSERKNFPKKVSAIYFAISAKDEVLYIGRAKCLYNRWNLNTHHKQRYLEGLANVRIAWMQVSDSSLLPEIERALINHFKPPCNGVDKALVSPGGTVS